MRIVGLRASNCHRKLIWQNCNFKIISFVQLEMLIYVTFQLLWKIHKIREVKYIFTKTNTFSATVNGNLSVIMASEFIYLEFRL